MGVTLTKSDNYANVATIKIDNGEFNFLDQDTLEELRTTVEQVPDDVAVLVVRGTDSNGKGGLTAGIPLHDVKDLSTTDAREMLTELHGAMATIRDCDCVTICGCGEYAIGAGLELAMSCDFRIATEEANLGLPEIDVGLVTGIQGGLLIRLVGLQAAKELIYTGELISGSEAETLGLVNDAVEPSQYEKTIEERLTTLSAKSPLVLSMQKQVFRNLRSNGIEAGVEASLETIAACFDTRDQTEAMEAFLDDREPTYEGR